MDTTTIQLDTKLKKKLDKLKIHSRETYNELIERVIGKSYYEIDRESLLATIEVLSDPELMRGIAEALEEEKRGEKGTTLEEVKKELKL